ncbi:MAG: gliding motility-associated-like protein [Polaribacter sp.]|jgi:gliding motility-associated-like protein
MKKLLPVLILFFTLNSFSQKEANFWYFGNNAALDFTSGEPELVSGSQLNTTEGCSSFSDSEGNLLFYIGAPTTATRNLTIWNKNNQAMPNGTGLQGDASSSQAALTVPAPENPNIYYIFTLGALSSGNAGFWYYTLDMSEDGGLGDIVDGPIVLGDGLNHPRWSEKVTAVKGNECNTFWVISALENRFYAYKVDKSGVNITNPIISSINGFNASDDPRGYLKVSPDGTKLVSANMAGGTFLFDFNNETGEVTNLNNSTLANSLNIDGNAYGAEFSPSSNRLYVSTGGFQQNTQENLYQFDLSQPTMTAINSSRFLVFNYRNTRGALQLGPNGKIYWTSDGDTSNNGNNITNSISVINRPEELGAACGYSHQSVLVGRGNVNPSQGLPPFISSLLLPIEIIDSETGNIINNEDLQFCVGDDKTIIPETVTGNNISYEWTFNNGTATNVISTDTELVLRNLQKINSGTYALKIELTDECGNVTQFNGDFNIEVFDAAVATKPSDIFFCDTDRDGFNTFDLQAAKTDEILNGLDPAIFEVLYFLNPADADSSANPLNNPYTNPTAFSSQTIYARVQNKNALDACFEITEFILAVTDLPIPTQPTPLRICDNLENESDTDGIVNTFILSDKDNEIYGSLDATQYNISYHTTQNGAEINDTNTLINKDTFRSVTNSEIVFVRVENKDNTNCYDASVTLELIVDPLPVLKADPEIFQCISKDNTNPTVNLTVAEINISNNYENENFEYYPNANGLDLIANPTSYPVQVNTPQSVFVKVISEFGCSKGLIELKINVGLTTNNAFNDLQLPECDDFLDVNGNNTTDNDDTDFITNFRLNKEQIEIDIKENVPNSENTTIFFYEKEQDRTNSLNEIDISNYRNDIDKIDITTIPGGIQFPIYYKILSNINNNCQGLGEFDLQINAVPTVSTTSISPIIACDTGDGDGNYLNGSNTNIDLTQKNDELFLGTNQNKENYEVTFYKSVTAALAGDATNPDYISNPSQFTNDTPTGFSEGDIAIQTIFVRIQSKITGCANAHASFQIIINPLPIIDDEIPVLAVCDTGSIDGNARNGLAQNMDVSIRDLDILGSRNPNDFTITYHKNQLDLEDLTSTGIDKNKYDSDPASVIFNPITSISEENLFVRIINNATGCLFDQSTLTIIVNPEPSFETIADLQECDNNNDGDDANGIMQNINLNSKIPEILGSKQNPDNFTVTFHASQVDATNGNNAIASPYENTNLTETIYVRIENKNTLCVNDEATFNVIVNPLPDFMITTPQIICLNDTPLTLVVESPRDVYTYIWKDENGTILNTTSRDNIDITTGGTYQVTATTTTGTFCERSEFITVNESDPAILDSSFITIIDEGNNLGNDGNLSISIDTISNNLGIGNYQFAILNTDNDQRTPIIGFQDEPLFENLEGGIYQIIVNDKNGCTPDTKLLVSVVQFPKFFTPNGDGQNDFWVIKGANKAFYPNASINIFNRFGKLVAQISIDSQGWNGLYQGKLLPSDDYWYNATLVPADLTKQPINKKGNFSLLRK